MNWWQKTALAESPLKVGVPTQLITLVVMVTAHTPQNTIRVTMAGALPGFWVGPSPICSGVWWACRAYGHGRGWLACKNTPVPAVLQSAVLVVPTGECWCWRSTSVLYISLLDCFCSGVVTEAKSNITTQNATCSSTYTSTTHTCITILVFLCILSCSVVDRFTLTYTHRKMNIYSNIQLHTFSWPDWTVFN